MRLEAEPQVRSHRIAVEIGTWGGMVGGLSLCPSRGSSALAPDPSSSSWSSPGILKRHHLVFPRANYLNYFNLTQKYLTATSKQVPALYQAHHGRQVAHSPEP